MDDAQREIELLYINYIRKQCKDIVERVQKLEQMMEVWRMSRYQDKIKEVFEELKERFPNASMDITGNSNDNYLSMDVYIQMSKAKVNKIMKTFHEEYWNDQSKEIKKLIRVNIIISDAQAPYIYGGNDV